MTASVFISIGTGGVAAFGIGALIGSVSVGAVGAGVGAACGYAAGGSDGALQGLALGFGIGATAGFIIGGIARAHSHIRAQSSSVTPIGRPFNPNQSVQIGVDPNTLTINRSLNKQKLKAVENIINKDGMYGIIKVNRAGFIIDGNHRVYMARILEIAVDVTII